jgi:3-phenylpropionate/trans-cinnamate dioxygenase ferredoxin subunit
MRPSSGGDRLPDLEFVRVASLTELPEGRMRSCRVAGREIVVCHTKAGLFALDNICTHAFARMSEGRLRGTKLICPLHGAAFDVRNGCVLGPPAVRPLVMHAVRIVQGAVEVALDPGAPPPPEI